MSRATARGAGVDIARRIWKLAPESVRMRPAVRRTLDPLVARQLAQSTQTGHAVEVAPSGARVVHTLDEVDQELAELERLSTISDAAMREGFSAFRYEPPSTALPADPFSDDYRAAVMRAYAQLAGKPYALANESSHIDADVHFPRPYPYGTGNSDAVRDHLHRVAHAIGCVAPEPDQRILELGAGWGNTTLAMAQMGATVTAVDVEPGFVDLIERRGRANGVPITALVGDFSAMTTLEPGFDTVLFFESFHHAADHRAVLEDVRRVLRPGGKVVFCAEPIDGGLPYPWGLRTDGESLWAIRRNGWLELGFRPEYFREMLTRGGFAVESRPDPFAGCDSYLATRER